MGISGPMGPRGALRVLFVRCRAPALIARSPRDPAFRRRAGADWTHWAPRGGRTGRRTGPRRGAGPAWSAGTAGLPGPLDCRADGPARANGPAWPAGPQRRQRHARHHGTHGPDRPARPARPAGIERHLGGRRAAGPGRQPGAAGHERAERAAGRAGPPPS